jgi:hypothetical protein
MLKARHRWLDSTLAWYFVVAWGSGIVATKVGLQCAAPFTIFTLHYAFGFTCLVPPVLLRPRWMNQRLAARRWLGVDPGLTCMAMVARQNLLRREGH